MMMTSGFWVALGLAVGSAHALALWRSAHRRRPWLHWCDWRVPAVAAVLAIAAIAGVVEAAAGGWAAGFAGASGLLVMRSAP